MPVKLMQNYKLKKVKKLIHAHTVLATGRDPLPHALKWKKKTAAALPFFRKCDATKFATNSGCNVLYE